MVYLLISGAMFIHRSDFPFHVCSRPVGSPALYLSTLTFAFAPVSGFVQAVVPPRPPHVDREGCVLAMCFLCHFWNSAFWSRSFCAIGAGSPPAL